MSTVRSRSRTPLPNALGNDPAPADGRCSATRVTGVVRAYRIPHRSGVLRSTAGYVPSLPSGLVHRLGLILRPIPPLAEATVVAISVACEENLHSQANHENRR